MKDPTNDILNRMLDRIKQEENALRSLDEKLFPLPLSPLQPLPEAPRPLDVFVNQCVRASSMKEMRAELFHQAAILRESHPELRSVPPFTDNAIYDVAIAMRNWCVDALKVRNGSHDRQSGPRGTRAQDSHPKNATSPEARALGVLAEHPDWTDKRIAKAAGVNRTTLYTWPRFKAARAAQKQAGKEHREARSARRFHGS